MRLSFHWYYDPSSVIFLCFTRRFHCLYYPLYTLTLCTISRVVRRSVFPVSLLLPLPLLLLRVTVRVTLLLSTFYIIQYTEENEKISVCYRIGQNKKKNSRLEKVKIKTKRIINFSTTHILHFEVIILVECHVLCRSVFIVLVEEYTQKSLVFFQH